MANLGEVLKDEIQRLAKRELKAILDGLRREVADLKRALAEHKEIILETSRGDRPSAKVGRPAKKSASAAPVDDARDRRITGKMILRIREKLDLSQAKFARLVGVSMPSVLHWEHKPGALRFRDEGTPAAILAVGDMGIREAQRRLKELASPKPVRKQIRKAQSKPAKTAPKKPARPRPQLIEPVIEEAPITAKMIRHHRERLGISQENLAKLIGVHSRSIYLWEHKPGVLKFMGDTRKAVQKVIFLGPDAIKRRLEALGGETAAEGNGRARRGAVAAAKQPKLSKPATDAPDEPLTAKTMRDMRKRLGLTQPQLARLLKLNRQTVYQWEHRPGVLRFRGKTKSAILSVMRMDANEVAARLAALGIVPVQKGRRFGGRRSRGTEEARTAANKLVQQSTAEQAAPTVGDLQPVQSPPPVQPTETPSDEAQVQDVSPVEAKGL